jgi:hypothetical protein
MHRTINWEVLIKTSIHQFIFRFFFIFTFNSNVRCCRRLDNFFADYDVTIIMTSDHCWFCKHDMIWISGAFTSRLKVLIPLLSKEIYALKAQARLTSWSISVVIWNLIFLSSIQMSRLHFSQATGQQGQRRLHKGLTPCIDSCLHWNTATGHELETAIMAYISWCPLFMNW